MNHDLLSYMAQEWSHTTILEIIAVVFAVAEVLLAYKNKWTLYPAGIISAGLYIWIYTRPHVRLYADGALNLYYLGMSVYGWILWTRGKGSSEGVLPISSTNTKEKLSAGALFLGSFIFLYLVLHHWTDSNTPLMDAFVSGMAWTGMWLLAKRKIENWLVLNISNLVAIPLYFYKHLPLTGLLTAFLFAVAILGYFKWKGIMYEKNMDHH